MKNILYIDTTNNKEIVVGLEIAGKKDEICEEVGEKRAQMVLSLIDQLLKKHDLTVQDLTAIEVNHGPGSFTGIRVGITIAQTLAKTLVIPLNGKIDYSISPVY